MTEKGQGAGQRSIKSAGLDSCGLDAQGAAHQGSAAEGMQRLTQKIQQGAAEVDSEGAGSGAMEGSMPHAMDEQTHACPFCLQKAVKACTS